MSKQIENELYGDEKMFSTLFAITKAFGLQPLKGDETFSGRHVLRCVYWFAVALSRVIHLACQSTVTGFDLALPFAYVDHLGKGKNITLEIKNMSGMNERTAVFMSVSGFICRLSALLYFNKLQVFFEEVREIDRILCNLLSIDIVAGNTFRRSACTVCTVYVMLLSIPVCRQLCVLQRKPERVLYFIGIDVQDVTVCCMLLVILLYYQMKNFNRRLQSYNETTGDRHYSEERYLL